MPDTAETEYGLWPTPNVPNGGRTMTAEDALNKGKTAKGKRQVTLENAVRFWPTPDADYTVQYRYARLLRNPAGGNTPDLKSYWQMYLVYELAVHLARAGGLDRLHELAQATHERMMGPHEHC